MTHNIKHLALAVLLGLTATAFTACNEKKSEQSNAINTDSLERALMQDSLNIAKAERDTLISLMEEVNSGLEEIRQLQDIVAQTDLSSETPSRRDQLVSNIETIKKRTQERIAKLNELENKLAKSERYSQELKTTVGLLRQQLNDQQTKIDDLTRMLDEAKKEIKTLNTHVDSLKTENKEVNREKERAEQENTRLANELNECYFVVGTNKELKQHKIIEGGFLRKTKIMEGDFSRNHFTQADKRTLNEIPLHSRKAKVWSKHPKESYEIVDNNGQKVLRILNATKFWELSNYLVIQVD